MQHPPFRRALRSYAFTAFAAVLLLVTADEVLAQRSGFRAEFGPFIVRPFLDERSNEPFAAVGRFRARPGASLGLGYDVSNFGVTTTVEAAGLEIGPARVRDGLGIGRRTAIFRSTGVHVHWTARPSLRSWSTRVSLGYVREVIDNLTVQSTELPAYFESADTALASEGLVVVSGAGARVGIGLRRIFADGSSCSGCLGLRIEATADLARFSESKYSGETFSLPEAGWGVTPRLSLVAEWLP